MKNTETSSELLFLEESVSSDVECQTQVATLMSHLEVNAICYDHQVAIGHIYSFSDRVPYEVYCVDPLSRTSVKLKPMRQTRIYAAVCAISSFLLVFGGKDERTEQVFASVEKYDAITAR